MTKRQKYMEDVYLSDEDHLLPPSASETQDNSLMVKPVPSCTCDSLSSTVLLLLVFKLLLHFCVMHPQSSCRGTVQITVVTFVVGNCYVYYVLMLVSVCSGHELLSKVSVNKAVS